MSEAEIQLALKIECLNRFIDRLKAIISDDIEVYLEAHWIYIQHQLTRAELFLDDDWTEADLARTILDNIQVDYAHFKSEYWPQLGQARLEYQVLSTADGLELEFRLP